LRATLTLNSAADGVIIWSTSVTRPASETEAMHHEAEIRMGAVFVCALDESARDRSIVSLDALKVYLQACEALPSGDDLHTRKLLRDVTALAPNFAQGWGTLAEWNGFIVGESNDDAPAARKEASDAAARALAFYVGPDNAFGAARDSMVIGRIDDAYARIGEMRRHLRNAPYVDNPSDFFGPFAAKFRADPRFMALAARLGLVAIWRATKWPDFCTARDAPYDCRAVAQKLTNQDERR
jgi:hypothetical protein